MNHEDFIRVGKRDNRARQYIRKKMVRQVLHNDTTIVLTHEIKNNTRTGQKQIEGPIPHYISELLTILNVTENKS